MEIYLLRHGEAEDRPPGADDASRELTSKGRKQAEQLVHWVTKHELEIDTLVASPLVRAVQTAEPIAAALNREVIPDACLAGGKLDVVALAELVSSLGFPASLLLVGHEPDMSPIVLELTGGVVDFKKAALAVVRCDRVRPGKGEFA